MGDISNPVHDSETSSRDVKLFVTAWPCLER